MRRIAFPLSTPNFVRGICSSNAGVFFRRSTSIVSLRAFSSSTPAPSPFPSRPIAAPSMDPGRKITDWVDPKDKSGEFKRQNSSFRDWIGRADADGKVRYPPISGRYHLYVSYACPWATRVLIARRLKGLEDVVSMSAVHWHLAEGGWRFVHPADTDVTYGGRDDGHGGTTPYQQWDMGVVPDPVAGHQQYTHLRQVYGEADPGYTGRITVPVLYDMKRCRIVSNESADILRMFGSAFDGAEGQRMDAWSTGLDLYPPALRPAIDEAHEWHYDLINNGVYKSGFATTQEAYERNVVALFGALDRAEKHLAGVAAAGDGPYWFGKTLTEVDIRLFVTIIRFDPVYVQHFKCNLKDIRSGYPHLHRWMRNLYWNVPAFQFSTNFLHIKNHYTKSHTQINPFSITPLGPVPDILPLDEEVPAVKAALSKE